MDNRNNTIAGWVLFAGICALGLTIGSGMLFASHDPHKPGYPIEDAEGGVDDELPADGHAPDDSGPPMPGR